MPFVDLKGSCALVTGGGTRVGAAICRHLASVGCDLIVHYRNNSAGAEQVAAHAHTLGRKVDLVQADLSIRREVERLVEEVTELCGGRLDVLVNNAANFERVTPDALDASTWDRAMDLNATAPYLLSVGLAPVLRSARGVMIAIACISANRPWKNYVPYAVSKAALAHVVRGLSVSLAPAIRVNAVAPGAVLLPDGVDEVSRDRLLRRIPLQRLGEADDVARAVVFLVQNDYVTGHILTVDGGRSLT